ncbi:MAG: nitrite/sulfite reductase [Clostridium sp.]
MENLKTKLLSEIGEFREIGHKFYNGEMSMMDFKHTSGGMGVYAHKGGKEFMIRLRIPSGIITIQQLNLIYDWAVKYNLDRLHFTTRQAIQYHGMSIDSVCDLMEDALKEDIYTRGAGGNFPRNVALSPLSGVDKDEAFDPTLYALATGNYFMERITSYKLPRKLKVSFSNTEKDTAHCTIQDLGFLSVNENSKNCFRVYLGGGLGRNPRLALIYPELINPEDVLYYVEAMVNLFKAEGNYENKAKARVRYMVEKLGEEKFISEYKKYVEEAKAKGGLDLEIITIECDKKGIAIDIQDERLFAQKQDGLYSVYVHPYGGQIKISDLKVIKDALAGFYSPELRLSMTEGVYVRNLDGNEAKKLLEVTNSIGGKTSFEYSVACIGVPTCQMGIGNSQETLNEMLKFVKENANKLELLPRVYISGCGNSCAVHEIGQIGFTGKKKRVDDLVQDAYELHVNGSFSAEDSRLGNSYGDILKKDIPMFIYNISTKLEEKSMDFVTYLEKYEADFKELFNEFKC